MATTDYKSVDQYIAKQPENVQVVLQKVRAAIRKAVPEAQETISYQMPAYKLNGRNVVYFAGWKEHFALYPGNGRLVAELREELAPYEVSKGTIRFPLSGRVPVKLIGRIARLRADEVAAQVRRR